MIISACKTRAKCDCLTLLCTGFFRQSQMHFYHCYLFFFLQCTVKQKRKRRWTQQSSSVVGHLCFPPLERSVKYPLCCELYCVKCAVFCITMSSPPCGILTVVCALWRGQGMVWLLIVPLQATNNTQHSLFSCQCLPQASKSAK